MFVVLVKEEYGWELCFQGKEPFCSNSKESAESFCKYLKEIFPEAEYKTASLSFC